jgi:hypothetical protein
MSPDSESKIIDNESSDEFIATEKIAGAYSTLLKFAKSQPCHSVQEVMELYILHYTSLHKQKECTKEVDICLVFKKSVSHTWTLQLYPKNGSDKTRWSVSI